ncbi:MAG: hypothetical protein L0331_05830 [Chloroflexi bacterium]|nr:hypothetical protein [Chloroflexota bacterium]
MYPEQWDVVERVNQQYHLDNTSAAMRLIVAEYDRMAGQGQPQEQRPVGQEGQANG